ncbi:hypothetical protein LDENG_00281660, partial [Lucifuga dentata]
SGASAQPHPPREREVHPSPVFCHEETLFQQRGKRILQDGQEEGHSQKPHDRHQHADRHDEGKPDQRPADDSDWWMD